MIESIEHKGQLLAIIIRDGHSARGIQFLTPPDFSQQLAYMKRPAGHEIAPHVHNVVRREVFHTQETLFVRRGKVRVDFYAKTRQLVCERILGAGDVVLLVSGGHGFEMIEESEIIEVKQGPYAGDGDKVRFEPAGIGDSSAEKEQ
jgi:hypothetical protein